MNTIEQTTFAPITSTLSPMAAQPSLYPTTVAADPFSAHERSVNYNEQRFLQKQAKRESKRATKNAKVANKDFTKSEKLYAKAADLSARGKETRAIKKQDRAARFAAAGQVHQTAASIAQQEVQRANSLQSLPGYGRSVMPGSSLVSTTPFLSSGLEQPSTFLPATSWNSTLPPVSTVSSYSSPSTGISSTSFGGLNTRYE
eukprot:TRINITY_DN111_c0_g1_i2.p1 TRINITY_DN111_c0_g1~~TRINITY_DN111_c0_g1_i2.p1  ORF type:complete len:201 (-),score=68.26 TRINITY_DN111_c0_g1_i2:48-650(-)